MARKTFYCYTHDRDEPRAIYGGKVGGYSHCLEAIAGARAAKERKHRESLIDEAEKLRIKKLKAQIFSKPKSSAEDVHKRAADKAFERELAQIEREAVEYDY